MKIIRAEQNLFEKIDHPNWLFHGTYNISDILESNCLKLGRSYGSGRAVCLTRSFEFAKRFPYILVLDKDKLRSRYKIKLQSDSKNMKNKFSRNSQPASKAEEVCETDILNLDKYLVYIVSDDASNENYISKSYFQKNYL